MPNSVRTQRGNGEGSVYKELACRKNGQVERWVAQTFVDGKKRRSIFDTEAKAKAGLRSMHRENATGAGTADGNVTVGEILNQWRTRSLAGRDASPKTVVAYDWCLSRLSAELGSKRIRSLGVTDVEKAMGDDGKPAKAGLIPTLEESIENKTILVGTPEGVAADVQFLKDLLGFEHLTIFPHLIGDPYPKANEQMERFIAEVVPLVS